MPNGISREGRIASVLGGLVLAIAGTYIASTPKSLAPERTASTRSYEERKKLIMI